MPQPGAEGGRVLDLLPPPILPSSIHVSVKGLAGRRVSKARLTHPDGEPGREAGVTQSFAQICDVGAVGS